MSLNNVEFYNISEYIPEFKPSYKGFFVVDKNNDLYLGLDDKWKKITSNGDSSIDGATTLSGYGITDAKIENGTIVLGDNTITPLTSSSDLNWNKLTNIPTSFTPSAHEQAWSTITGTPTTLDGYGITDAVKSESGKGLSTNDYTTDEKTKLSGIESGAEVNVNADWNSTSGDSQILNKPNTLSGYGITDAKIENNVITLGSDTIKPKVEIDVVNMTGTTATLSPNKFYVWGNVSSLNISLETPSDSSIYNEYMFQFTSGSTATTLSLPASITWYQDYNTILANTTYQISIVNNLAVLGEF